jgi:Zn-dependent M16 (insulinase) family peptidase
VKNNGYGYAQRRLSSYISSKGVFSEQASGINYYRFINDLALNFEKKSGEIAENLSKTAALLFNKNNMKSAVICSGEDFELYSNQFQNFTLDIASNKSEIKEWNLKAQKKNEGILTSSKVQYIIKGYDFNKLGFTWNGRMRVLEQIISTEWLQKRIRVIGGAYGGFCGVSQYGPVLFASYRDPNLKETLENFDLTADFISKFIPDEKEMTRFIIGTIAGLDNPLTPSEKGDVAVRRYFEKTKQEDVQRDRNEVLSTKPEDIKSMAKLIESVLSQNVYCVYGNEDKLRSEKQLFTELIKPEK